MSADSGTVTTLIPLLFLVVTQLSTVGRDADLDEAVEEERDPLGFPLFRVIFPPLGRFNFIHGSNLVILSSGLVLITILSDGWVRIGTSLLTLVMFVVLPVLEVDEYAKILRSDAEIGPIPNLYSFHVHVVFAVAITTYVFLFGSTIPQNPMKGFSQPAKVAPFFSGLVLLIGVAYLLFTRLLHRELDDANGHIRTRKVHRVRK